MIYSQVMQEQNKVYIKVDGYVSNSDIKGFIRDYKTQIKGIKTNKFNLVILLYTHKKIHFHTLPLYKTNTHLHCKNYFYNL